MKNIDAVQYLNDLWRNQRWIRLDELYVMDGTLFEFDLTMSSYVPIFVKMKRDIKFCAFLDQFVEEEKQDGMLEIKNERFGDLTYACGEAASNGSIGYIVCYEGDIVKWNFWCEYSNPFVDFKLKDGYLYFLSSHGNYWRFEESNPVNVEIINP